MPRVGTAAAGRGGPDVRTPCPGRDCRGATAEAARRQLEADLTQQLAAARRYRDKLADRLRAEPAAEPSSWTLRGELLTHLNRLSSELEAGHRARAGLQRPHRSARWSRRVRRTRLRPRHPPRR